MLRVDYGHWGQTPADLRHLALSALHPRSRERFLALHDIAQGSCATEVAERTDRRPHTVMDWLHTYNEHGPEALMYRRTGGRPPFCPKIEAALDVARETTTREVDLGRAAYRTWEGGEETKWFANAASAGLSGAVAKRVNETGKALGGKVSYAWSTLAVFARWRNAEVSVEVGAEKRSGPMYDVIVANGRYLGGGMKITPDAEPDDGLFDVLLIGDISKGDLLRNLPKLYRGTHLPHPKAEVLRGATATIDAPVPLPVQLDGEQPGTTPATFEVVPRALRLRVP